MNYSAKNTSICTRRSFVGKCSACTAGFAALSLAGLPVGINSLVSAQPSKEKAKVRAQLEELLENIANSSQDNLISKEILFKEVILNDIDEIHAERMLNELITQGLLYEPKNGYYKLI